MIDKLTESTATPVRDVGPIHDAAMSHPVSETLRIPLAARAHMTDADLPDVFALRRDALFLASRLRDNTRQFD